MAEPENEIFTKLDSVEDEPTRGISRQETAQSMTGPKHTDLEQQVVDICKAEVKRIWPDSNINVFIGPNRIKLGYSKDKEDARGHEMKTTGKLTGMGEFLEKLNNKAEVKKLQNKLNPPKVAGHWVAKRIDKKPKGK